MSNRELTARQEIFARHYALTGPASRGPIAAGANPASARTTEYRMLKKVEIRERIDELREAEFSSLRNEVARRLCASVEAALMDGLRYSEARRAISPMNRLGVYRYANAVSGEIAELEQRFGVPFKEILSALAEARGRAEMLLGHKRIETTLRYSHLGEAPARGSRAPDTGRY